MKGEEIATIIGASLGLIGALLIIIIFLYFKSTKIFYRKLVFILSIYDLFQSLSFLLPGNSDQNLCKIQYYFLAIFTTTSQFWSASISVISYLKVVKQIDDKKLNKIQKWSHLIMLIPIIVLIIIAAYAHDYDDSKTYWCASTTQIYLIRLRNIISPSASDIIAIDILHSLLASSQGFWDFWIFVVFDPEMRNKIKGCCCCCSNLFHLQENELSDISAFEKLPNQENDLFLSENPKSKSSGFRPLLQNSNKEESLN
ncbi:hypothetical protein M0811_14210 [Anaeramoeba ignava]|uniref:G-protein coupled receptors family 2 profile 2 domain-containing protein n=1 Tax=Anaeramoeba ignava TaxID=1746090 RepID=A0A9Q0LU77_ANAIG|nr:hypothetical protein M0811_14210 [Anaeramoeba ignava]